jgi:hypothetical protein
MLERHMPVPFDLACVVDRPRQLPGSIQVIDASSWPPPREGMRVTAYKLGLYDPHVVPFPEFLYIDPTSVIRCDMTPLLEFAFAQPHDLVAVKDWYYDAYNTCAMRIRQSHALSEIPREYQAGREIQPMANGDQDFVTGVIRENGNADVVTTFPEGMVQSFGIARRAEKVGRRRGYELLEKAVIVKFCGALKMDTHISPRYRLRQVFETQNPLHRRAWFWVREIKELWR